MVINHSSDDLLNIQIFIFIKYIVLIPILEDELKKLREISKSDYLLLSSFNKPFYSHDVIAKRFKLHLIDINIRKRKLYKLRYTFVTYILSNVNNGIDMLWVSKMLGHKDLSITLKVYAKNIKEDDETKIMKRNKIGEIIGKF